MTNLDCISKIRESQLVNFRDTCSPNGKSFISDFRQYSRVILGSIPRVVRRLFAEVCRGRSKEGE